MHELQGITGVPPSARGIDDRAGRHQVALDSFK
jgi:hypothetical protein